MFYAHSTYKCIGRVQGNVPSKQCLYILYLVWLYIDFVLSCYSLHHSLATTGQFWGVPFTVTAISENSYSVTMFPPTSDLDVPMAMNRTFAADLGDKTWSLNHEYAKSNSKCLYAGNGQGGPESDSDDSVIQGNWTDYITDGLYKTNWIYSRYTAATCP